GPVRQIGRRRRPALQPAHRVAARVLRYHLPHAGGGLTRHGGRSHRGDLPPVRARVARHVARHHQAAAFRRPPHHRPRALAEADHALGLDGPGGRTREYVLSEKADRREHPYASCTLACTADAAIAYSLVPRASWIE